MTWHDANIRHFWQWWRRNIRNGHAYAEGAALHGGPPEWHWLRESLSNWFWGLIVPVVLLGVILCIIFDLPGWADLFTPLLPLPHAILWSRIYLHRRRQGDDRATARLYATFTAVGKLPNAQGQIWYCWNRLLGRRSTLIEYKGSAGVTTGAGAVEPTAGAANTPEQVGAR
jgi:hypothetical protein